ncbi:MAG: glycosyltransferase family 4 protein [Anaerolineae bacterium]
MRDERLLFVGGWNMLHGMNHRSRHLAAFLGTRFRHIDLLGYENLSEGPPASAWASALRGLRAMARPHISPTLGRPGCQIALRDPFAPGVVGLGIKDLWHYAQMSRLIRQPYDLAIIGHPNNAWLAALLKRSGMVKRFIYDDWDSFPGLERTRVAQRAIESRELICVRAADAVMTVNGLLADLRRQQGARKVLVVPNGVDLSLFKRARNKPTHPPTMAYTGTLSPLWGIDLAIRAMPALLQSLPDLRFLIAGSGPAATELQSLSRSLGVAEHVHFLGQLEYHELPDVLAQADVGILTSRPDSAFRKYASPLKLIEYLAAGLPVIATRVGQTEITMREANAGVLIDYSVEQFVAASHALLTDPPAGACYARAAKVYAARFDWPVLLEQACQFIEHILEEGEAQRIPSSQDVQEMVAK